MNTQKHIDNLIAQSDEDTLDRARFQGFLRNAVCNAIDEAVEHHGTGKLLDQDLPDLFRYLDKLAETLFLRGGRFGDHVTGGDAEGNG